MSGSRSNLSSIRPWPPRRGASARSGSPRCRTGVGPVHENVAVTGQRLGAERAGVQGVPLPPPGFAQRLRVEEEEGTGHGRRHASPALWAI
jgi:hypothetical protein